MYGIGMKNIGKTIRLLIYKIRKIFKRNTAKKVDRQKPFIYEEK